MWDDQMPAWCNEVTGDVGVVMTFWWFVRRSICFQKAVDQGWWNWMRKQSKQQSGDSNAGPGVYIYVCRGWSGQRGRLGLQLLLSRVPILAGFVSFPHFLHGCLDSASPCWWFSVWHNFHRSPVFITSLQRWVPGVVLMGGPSQWLQPEPPGVQGVPPGAHSSFAAVACWLSYFLLQSSPREPHIGRRTSLPCSSRKLLPAAISQEWIQARFWIELTGHAETESRPTWP